MKPFQAKEIIIGKAEGLVHLSEEITQHFELETIDKFRHEFRIIRSFMTFVRLQRNDKNIKVPENCKYLYHLAGKIKEVASEIEKEDASKDVQEAADALIAAKKDWKKNYSKNTFPRFTSKLLALDYSKLHPDLLDNFFNNIGKETMSNE